MEHQYCASKRKQTVDTNTSSRRKTKKRKSSLVPTSTTWTKRRLSSTTRVAGMFRDVNRHFTSADGGLLSSSQRSETNNNNQRNKPTSTMNDNKGTMDSTNLFSSTITFQNNTQPKQHPPNDNEDNVGTINPLKNAISFLEVVCREDNGNEEDGGEVYLHDFWDTETEIPPISWVSSILDQDKFTPGLLIVNQSYGSFTLSSKCAKEIEKRRKKTRRATEKTNRFIF